ncbi:MAG: hypothetical protein AB1659_02365 [Thermodesulfobacteriota bacterium]
MKNLDRSLLIIFALFLTGSGFFFHYTKVSAILLTRDDHANRIIIKVAPGEEFIYFYIHSIYGAPVQEEFRAGRDKIMLIGVQAAHAGVREYYGFEGSDDFNFVKREFKSPIAIKIGESESQGIIAGRRTVSFGEIGKPGDRILLSVKEYSLASYIVEITFFSRFFKFGI